MQSFVVGVGRISILLGGTRSLKEKRSVVRRVIARVREKFNVSVAEVGALDVWNHALLGFAVVSNDGPFVDRVLSQVITFVGELRLAEIGEVSTEVLHV